MKIREDSSSLDLVDVLLLQIIILGYNLPTSHRGLSFGICEVQTK